MAILALILFMSALDSTAMAAGDPQGACCLPVGVCIVMTEESCGAFPYMGDGTTCDPDPCPEIPTGACCLELGDCRIVNEFSCMVVEDGVYQGDDTFCDPNPCPQPTLGACCDLLDGSCVVTFVEDCNGTYREYQGDDSTCEPHPCPPLGACCAIDGSCFLWTEPGCLLDGGDYLGEGTACDPNPCVAIPFGACCLPNFGPCEILTETSCLEQGGEFQGDDARCFPSNPCPEEPTGACCDESGDCSVVTADECGGASNYLGDGTECDPYPCSDPEAACCLPDESCVFLSEEDCLSANGEYLGDDVQLCEPGVTCAGTSDVENGALGSGTLDAFVRPNPARSDAWIEWKSPVASRTDLEIFDASGRVLRRLTSGSREAGVHQVRWDGRDRDGVAMPSGVYYYRLTLRDSGEQVSEKIYLVR